MHLYDIEIIPWTSADSGGMINVYVWTGTSMVNTLQPGQMDAILQAVFEDKFWNE